METALIISEWDAGNWMDAFQHHSPFLLAGVKPVSFHLCLTNRAFQHCFNLPESGNGAILEPDRDGCSDRANQSGVHPSLLDLLSEQDGKAFRQLYYQHLLARILQLAHPDWLPDRWLNQPIVVSVPALNGETPRQVQLWLRSDHLTLNPGNSSGNSPENSSGNSSGNSPGAHIDPWDWTTISSPAEVLAQVEHLTNHPELAHYLQTYPVTGWLRKEGVDVAEQELVNQLVRLLVGPESFMQPRKFIRVNRLMKALFRAQSCCVLYPENDQARLFKGLSAKDIQVYSLQELQASQFIQVAETNRVTHIPDLSSACPTACERSLLLDGIRSLLMVPLVAETKIAGKSSRKLAGVFAVGSDQPYHFDACDRHHAESLIHALTAAMRNAIQQRFAKIHPAVEWRFAQEAERRSWGFTAEPIIFTDVYPLYGISDIRGSSNERNRAIQADLLTQFQLALDIVKVLCEQGSTAFGHQLYQDLNEQMEGLNQQITVDAEVTLVRYLQENVEVHFEYFQSCGPQAEAAITAYRSAQDVEQGCVYQARAQYDRTISQINTRLRKTWNRWQNQMQQIVPHYCDIETTDGIDHMIYTGSSIAANFQAFHLCSLRYDQLRAVCDCARTGFALKQDLGTEMEITHLVLVQTTTVDIFHDESTESLFDVKGTRDTRYEIVKKRIDKALDSHSRTRITQPGMLTLVYSTSEDWEEYQQYCHYLMREGWIAEELEFGAVEPLQGVTGLKFARSRILLEGEAGNELGL